MLENSIALFTEAIFKKSAVNGKLINTQSYVQRGERYDSYESLVRNIFIYHRIHNLILYISFRLLMH